jgi:Na+-driven multidrug efflux pump
VLAKGDSRSIFHISVAEMLLKMTLGFWFIQCWGLEGLAWSVVISFWVEKLGLMYILEFKHKVRTAAWLEWKWYLGYAFLLFGTYFLLVMG